jgi:hypothetical protein
MMPAKARPMVRAAEMNAEKDEIDRCIKSAIVLLKI